jgi:hypothetical protein
MHVTACQIHISLGAASFCPILWGQQALRHQPYHHKSDGGEAQARKAMIRGNARKNSLYAVCCHQPSNAKIWKLCDLESHSPISR